MREGISKDYKHDSESVADSISAKYTKLSSKIRENIHKISLGIVLASGVYLTHALVNTPTPPKEYSIVKKEYDSLSNIVKMYSALPSDAKVPQFSEKIKIEENKLEAKVKEASNTPDYEAYNKDSDNYKNKLLYSMIGVMTGLTLVALGSMSVIYFDIKKNKAIKLSKEKK